MVLDQTMVRQGRADPKTLAGVLTVVAVCAIGLMEVWNTFMADLSAVYMAGYFYGIGKPELIYDAPPGFFGSSPPTWAPYMEDFGLGDQFVTPYVYPPLWAAMISPIATSVSPQAFFNGVAVLQATLGALSIWLAWRIAGPRAPALWIWLMMSAGLLLTSLISTFAFLLMQPQILVTFLTLLAFERYLAGRAGLAGSILGLAAMLKLAPAGFALIFLLDRNWRALGAFAATCAVIGGLGLFLIGPELHLAFRAAVDVVQNTLFLSSTNYSVTPLLPVLGDWLGLLPPLDVSGYNVRIRSGMEGARLASKAVFALLVLWMVLRTQRMPEAVRLPVRLMSLSLLLNLFGPLGWIHYYLLPLLLLPSLPAFLPPARAYAVIGIFGLLTSNWLFWRLREVWNGDLASVSFSVAVMLCLFFAILTPGRRSDGDWQG
ncbi:uncharacterized protein DUF2029 [Aliiruegeria haliotis]|uniref:Uncharacterized protein DUF2029 n=1 Tax=Aliiruegeria haliotis TaxID=1280846 RepID=A0A2T0RKS4_9RHOB|nr:glycosyltransferase family 87 protein [Aliiruegeria haliotis]PRY21789.1 uncharacterized protein DUF2029 [Aliiruegeria haliotis]